MNRFLIVGPKVMEMIWKWNAIKTWSFFGTLLLIPWDLFMGFGYTFSVNDIPPVLDHVFVWTTFWLTVPAVVISWVMPKLSGYWILVNTGISISIVAYQRIIEYIEYRRHPYELAMPLPLAILAQVLIVGVAFWGGKILFGLAGLRLSRLGRVVEPPSA
jgi:hypothetical protein